jgi:hypothetical protein
MSPKTNTPRRWRRTFAGWKTPLIALLICAIGMAGSKAAGSNQVSSNSKAETTASPVLSSLQAKTGAEGKGAFKLVYVPVKDQKLAHIEKLIKDSKLFDEVIDVSNKELILPVDLTVVFRECNGKDENGEQEDPTNAWYNPNNHSITMCYGLIQKSEDLFRDDEKGDDLAEAVLGSTVWTFYHELGHALIDIYKIAHTGKEEDAADELSTYILINEGGEAGEMAALNGAEDFYREAGESDLSEEQFADSHSLDKQRFYNIICLVYGSDTKKYASLTQGKDAILPEGRAEGCEQEYERVTKAWSNILGPHLKPNK